LGATRGAEAVVDLDDLHFVPEPSVVAPFEYTPLLWAILFGFLVWGDVLTTLVLMGNAVVIVSGIYVLHKFRGPSRILLDFLGRACLFFQYCTTVQQSLRSDANDWAAERLQGFWMWLEGACICLVLLRGGDSCGR
jgi:hypothetical protein